MDFELRPIMDTSRRRGRPRRRIPVVITSVRIPEDVYDAISRRSFREGESVHGLLQDAIAAYISRNS